MRRIIPNQRAMRPRTTVLLIHSSAIMRQGLTELLRRTRSIELIADTPDPEQALRLVRDVPLHAVIFECASAENLETCRQLHAAAPHLPLVLMGPAGDLSLIMRAFNAGGTVFVPADVPFDGLTRVLEEIHTLGRSAGPYLARAQRHAPAPAADDPQLSSRECQVLSLVAKGKANKEIGRLLSISENTVRNHIAHIFDKLGVQDRTEAAVQAVQRGLV